jgi:hypothetical protein
VLTDLYPDKTGHEILDDFDLVAANSGGSLVLGGLVANMNPRDIEKMFCDEDTRRQLFHKKSTLGMINLVRRTLGFVPKYTTRDKLAGIENVFRNAARKTGVEGKLLANTQFIDQNIELIDQNFDQSFDTDLVIASFDYDRQRAKLFRSNVDSKAATAGDKIHSCRLVEAINASSTAPIKFFDKPATVNWQKNDAAAAAANIADLQITPGDRTDRFWDGGVAGFNNPVLIAITEALANGVRPSDIIALSIGTGTARLPLASDFVATAHNDKRLVTTEAPPSTIADLKKMAVTILSDPPDSASYIAHVILTNGDTGRLPLVRMNPFIRPRLGADGNTLRPPSGLEEQDIQDLCNLEMDAVEQQDVDKIVRMTENWMRNGESSDESSDAGIANQPIRHSGRAFEKCVIGHSTYGEAKRDWLKISRSSKGRGG